MDDMTNLGQGFHAFQGTYMFPNQMINFAVVPNRNAMLRVAGDLLTPVELMDFKVQQ